MSEQNCSSCRFWKGDGDSPPVLGTCQRFSTDDDRVELTAYAILAGLKLGRPCVMAFDQPTTMASEWCGEFQERPIKAEQQAER
jgi:hypothetical protein